ncbi:MAG: hypothetical protein C4B59_17535 [Candidatus Methanogaster sp.]|uniref:Uncharacterized protein n=1 Tax=Candidatus Methanogaster sp. TaxID=3386292 RepID=A0AC61KXS7_9EURY|nr:MAG: hypothetical protein C4B59_17535 [ANME-2 cluster archaeon]
MKKHTKQIAAFLMVLTVVFIAGCTEKMSAEQIAARMKAQEESIKDFSAMVVMTISVGGNNTTMRVKVMNKMPDKDRAEFVEPASIAGRVIVRNGSTMWMYDPAINQATKARLQEDDPYEIDYTRYIKDIMNETDISYEGIGNVDGQRAYVILVTPHDETDRNNPISRTRAWIDCKDWMPLRIVMYGEKDKRNISVKMEFNNITFNAGIPDSEFIFEVPEGVQVVSDDWVPDAAHPAPVSEAVSGSVMAHPIFTNWRYMSYQNLSISNAPALNQTARITYSIIPDRDMEILSVQVVIPDDGFELIDIDDTWPHTRYNWTYRDTNDVRWYPTNLSKDTMYQFNATIKAVKTGNWTLSPSGSNKGMYISVYEDSACIRDEPFPNPPSMAVELNMSESEKIGANIVRTASKPSRSNFTPIPLNISEAEPFDLVWDGTKWVYVQNRS